jgi:hypothetical protein
VPRKARQAYRRPPYPPPPQPPPSSTTRQAQLHICYACVSYTSECVGSTEAKGQPTLGEGLPSARHFVRLEAGYDGKRLEMRASFLPELHRLWRPTYLRSRPPAHALQGLRRRDSLRAWYPHPSICCFFHRQPYWFWARGRVDIPVGRVVTPAGRAAAALAANNGGYVVVSSDVHRRRGTGYYTDPLFDLTVRALRPLPSPSSAIFMSPRGLTLAGRVVTP